MAILKQITFEGLKYNLDDRDRVAAAVATASDTTLVQAAVPNFSNAVTVAASTLTLAYATHMSRPVIQTQTCVFTVPAVAALQGEFWIVNGADNGTLMTISPDSGDRFVWDVAGASGTNNKDIVNTAATAKKGDYVKFRYGSADGWIITEMGGTWVDES